MPDWGIVILIVFFVVIGCVILFLTSKGIFSKAKFWTKWGGFEVEGNNKKLLSAKNQKWIIGPDEGKYDLSSGNLRHIPDPETLESLGYNRSKFIRFTDKEFKEYSIGHEIQSVKTARLVRKINTTGVYAVIEGLKRWVPNPETLQAIGRNFEEVNDLRPEDFDIIPQGEKLVEVSKWSTQK